MWRSCVQLLKKEKRPLKGSWPGTRGCDMCGSAAWARQTTTNPRRHEDPSEGQRSLWLMTFDTPSPCMDTPYNASATSIVRF
ncbi:hypothetical protein GCM10010306_078040 [Streptomyces umbrinus]|nr:hypothetical protein GCM10010306_078040 [Streptomyces umbrinus]